MTDKLKGFLERHNHKIKTMTCIKKIQQMKKLIEFTKNWKHRNLLHVVGGFLMGAFLSWLFAWYVSLVLIITFANYWEFCQKKDFGAKYSISDIILTTLGGVISIALIHFFT